MVIFNSEFHIQYKILTFHVVSIVRVSGYLKIQMLVIRVCSGGMVALLGMWARGRGGSSFHI